MNTYPMHQAVIPSLWKKMHIQGAAECGNSGSQLHNVIYMSLLIVCQTAVY